MFEQLIGQHPFFQGIHEAQIEVLAERAARAEFKPGEYIFRNGNPAQEFYLIQHGKVALEVPGVKGGSLIIETIRDGDVLGWSWLFPPYRWHFDARAVEATFAVALDAGWLRDMCENDHNLGYTLMKRLAQVTIQRLQATRLQLLDFYGNPSERR